MVTFSLIRWSEFPLIINSVRDSPVGRNRTLEREIPEITLLMQHSTCQTLYLPCHVDCWHLKKRVIKLLPAIADNYEIM